MKKTLTLLALIGLVSAASAASMTWTVSSIKFNGSTLNATTGAGLTAYLVFLGNGGTLADSYTVAEIDSLKKVDSATGTTAKGAVSSDYVFTKPESGDCSELNGNVYALLLSYTSEGKTYYNLGSATYTVSGMDEDGSTALSDYKPAAATFSYGTKNDSGPVTSGGGWTAVPEPSTAALALAGLALLLKRRKA